MKRAILLRLASVSTINLMSGMRAVHPHDPVHRLAALHSLCRLVVLHQPLAHHHDPPTSVLRANCLSEKVKQATASPQQSLRLRSCEPLLSTPRVPSMRAYKCALERLQLARHVVCSRILRSDGLSDDFISLVNTDRLLRNDPGCVLRS